MLPRPFRLQSMWMSHPSFSEVVDGSWLGTNPLQTKISVFTESAKVWNKEVFGNLVHKKSRLEARLRGIQVSLASSPNSFLVNLEKQLRLEFLDILQLEEEFWAMKSRINWIVQGERNTNFFHTSVVVRRKRNRIVSLKDNLVAFGVFLGGMLGFLRLRRVTWSLGVTLLEVKEALWSLKPFKAPGPDGLHAGFFQRYWGSVGDAVFKEVSHIFDTGCMPEFLNQTLLTLIPKCPGADCLGNFRPISLCNTLYKVVTKIIVKRLRVALPKLVSPLQTAFVPGRKGIDNMILVQELVHTMGTKKGKEGYMAIKIDLEKAYDRLEWHFIRDILLLFNFPASMIKLILSCVSSSSISVLFNGGKLEEFKPSRGIRQGDPLSPYLFILCMELLGFLIHEKCEANLWNPLKVARGGPAFSHLFFADDLVLFAKADRKNCCHIREVLDTFCDLSGQKVNMMKSKVYFSPNVKVDVRTDLCLVLGFNSTPNLGRYLGFPIHQPRSSSHEFDFLLDRVQGKLAGWKASMLSMAGRLILTQAVTTSIPSYVMQGALLPGKILHRLDKVNRDFLWGSTEEKKKDASSLLAKLCWRFKTNHVDGWANALRKKYLGPPRPRKCNFSKTWKALKKGEDICDKGSRWVIGSNSILRFWYDPWIKQGNLRSLIVGPLHYEEEKLLVKDVVVNGDWHLQHLSFVFPPSVLSVLQATPLRKSSVSEDKLCWMSSSKGDFDSGNAYCLAADQESILHVLRDCYLAKSFWHEYNYSIFDPDFFSSNLDTWLQSNACCSGMVPNKGYQWGTLFLFVALNCDQTKTFVVKIVKWDKPPDRWFKLNTDGSAAGNPGHAGCGGLIRDWNGEWFKGFSRKIGPTSSVAAELWALRDGLNLCLLHHLTAVIIELDAKLVVNLMVSSNSFNGENSVLVDDCRELLTRIPHSRVQHCFREANRCADALAKRGVTLPQVFCVFDNPPPDVSVILNHDILGLSSNRLCIAGSSSSLLV
uniref:Reverse transcriptase domain-containing protein n=1 Tax=Fagus sylvatica TaxID=28930 RepID=A0A2N9I899_FAGSY